MTFRSQRTCSFDIDFISLLIRSRMARWIAAPRVRRYSRFRFAETLFLCDNLAPAKDRIRFKDGRESIPRGSARHWVSFAESPHLADHLDTPPLPWRSTTNTEGLRWSRRFRLPTNLPYAELSLGR